MDATVLPAGWVNVTVPVADLAQVALVTDTLERFGVLAALCTVDVQREGILRGRVLIDDEDVPLAIAEADVLGWRTADARGLVIDLARQFGRGVSLDAVFFGDDGQPAAPTPAEVDTIVGRNVDGFAWFARGDQPIVGLSARHLHTTLLMAPVDGGTLLADPAATNHFISLDPLSQRDNVILWRLGERRGAMLQFRAGSAIHSWDEEWTMFDFAKPWLRDAGGRAAADYLRDAVAVADHEGEWTALLQLGEADARRLRVLLRHARSDASTLATLTTIVGAPGIVAEVAEGSTTIAAIPGVAAVEPTSLWRALRDRGPRPDR